MDRCDTDVHDGVIPELLVNAAGGRPVRRVLRGPRWTQLARRRCGV